MGLSPEQTEDTSRGGQRILPSRKRGFQTDRLSWVDIKNRESQRLREGEKQRARHWDGRRGLVPFKLINTDSNTMCCPQYVWYFKIPNQGSNWSLNQPPSLDTQPQRWLCAALNVCHEHRKGRNHWPSAEDNVALAGSKRGIIGLPAGG